MIYLFTKSCWVFPKCYHWISEFCDKNSCNYSKRVQTCHLLCGRSGCYHSAVRHTWKTESLIWLQFILQWFIRFFEFTKLLFLLGKILKLLTCSKTFFVCIKMANLWGDWRIQKGENEGYTAITGVGKRGHMLEWKVKIHQHLQNQSWLNFKMYLLL